MANKKLYFSRVKDSFANILFPSKIKCIVCDSELDGTQNKEVCDECDKKIKYIDSKICKKCGEPIDNNSGYCKRCKTTKIYFKKARAVCEYDDVAIKLIHNLKDNNKRYLATSLAGFMCDEIIKNDFSFDKIVYVPSHKSRLKKRGYNQSKLLAVEIAKKFNTTICDNVLVKHQKTLSQAELSMQDRLVNLENAFSVTDKNEIMGKNILLVDDVFTTGATANECSKTLIENMAKNVYVITFAHTLLTQKNNKKLVKTT